MSAIVDEKKGHGTVDSVDEKGSIDIIERVILEDDVYKHEEDEGVDRVYELKSAMGTSTLLSRVPPRISES